MTRKIKGFGNFEGFDVDAYQRRLRILREVVAGANQTEFAKKLGIDFKRWSNYERGYPVPREVAFMIHKTFQGMSIEWIWFGSKTSLSPYYRDKIDLAEKLDIERERDIAAVNRARQRLDENTAKRKKALASPKSRAR